MNAAIAAPVAPRPLWVRIGGVLLVFGLALGAVTARVVLAGERELAASTAALEAGDPHEATVRARRAAAWYAPGAPHVRVAYERLMALGREAEARRRPQIALLAFEGVREASLSTRWLFTPHASEVVEAEQAIARLRAQDPRPPSAENESAGAIERELLQSLAARPGPSRVVSAALGASFLAWAGGIGWVLAQAVGATGRFDRRRALPGLVIGAAGVLAWLVLLLVA